MKIAFICKKRNDTIGGYTNITYGLWNSASFVANFLNILNNIDAQVFLVEDYNCIDKVLVDNNPDLVILEALWVIPSKLDELMGLLRHKNRKWIVRTHSEWPFFANEGIAVNWLMEYGKLQSKYPNKLYIAPNTNTMTRDIKQLFGIKSLYLPNIYYPSTLSEHRKNINVEDGIIHIGCFGSIRPLKNQLIQAMAAIEIADSLHYKLAFHINASRTEQDGGPVLKNIRMLFNNDPKHSLVEHGWEEHEKFIEIVKQMHLGLQVSFTETFNIVAADFVWNFIPLVGSPTIFWLPNIYKAEPTSLKNIVEVGQYCWKHRRSSVMISKAFLTRQNNKAMEIWIDTIKKI